MFSKKAQSPHNRVRLRPLAMVQPTRKRIYSPNPFADDLVISLAQFEAKYKNKAQAMKVCLEPGNPPNRETILKNWQQITVYPGPGLWSPWYYVVSGV